MEETALNKVTKFIFNTKPNHIAETVQDYLIFERKLRLKYNFSEADNLPPPTPTPESRLKENTGWTPPTGQDPHIDTYCILTLADLIKEAQEKKATQEKQHQPTRDGGTPQLMAR